MTPCRACGKPKPRRTGSQNCEACGPKMKGKRPCRVCGKPKPRGQGRALCEVCAHPAAILARERQASRMRYRINAEKAGRPWPKDRNVKGGSRMRDGFTLPVEPFAVWLRTVFAQRTHEEHEDISRDLGLADRQARAFFRGEWKGVQCETAERTLLNYGRTVRIDGATLKGELEDWARKLPGNGWRLLRYMDHAEKVAHLADVDVDAMRDLWPEIRELS